MIEYILATWHYPDGSFEVYRRFQRPVWLSNSVFFMDHDSEGRCYCRWLLHKPRT